MAGVLEQCRLVGSWKLSLYYMHLIVLTNSVLYAWEVVNAL